MPDLHRIREQIAGLACPYPNIIPFREGWECCKARHLAIIDAAIAANRQPQFIPLEQWADHMRKADRVSESMPTPPAATGE
jgi:hypothetical protein